MDLGGKKINLCQSSEIERQGKRRMKEQEGDMASGAGV